MSNIVIQASYTIKSGENIYTLTVNDKGKLDLLYEEKSLKAKRLAKDTAIDLIKEFGWEEDLKKLPNHPNRNLPYTDTILELLKTLINEDTKWN